jgi:hypothetical protein
MSKEDSVLIRNEQEESRLVRRDLKFVISLNAILFLLLIGLYFINRATGSVDAFFVNLLKF